MHSVDRRQSHEANFAAILLEQHRRLRTALFPPRGCAGWVAVAVDHADNHADEFAESCCAIKKQRKVIQVMHERFTLFVLAAQRRWN